MSDIRAKLETALKVLKYTPFFDRKKVISIISEVLTELEQQEQVDEEPDRREWDEDPRPGDST